MCVFYRFKTYLIATRIRYEEMGSGIRASRNKIHVKGTLPYIHTATTTSANWHLNMGQMHHRFDIATQINILAYLIVVSDGNNW